MGFRWGHWKGWALWVLPKGLLGEGTYSSALTVGEERQRDDPEEKCGGDDQVVRRGAAELTGHVGALQAVDEVVGAGGVGVVVVAAHVVAVPEAGV